MRQKFLLVCLSALLFLPFSASFAAHSSADVKTEQTATTAQPSSDELKDAMKELKNLKRSEKKSRFKEMKKALKKMVADKKAGDDVSTNTLLLVLISILIPPLAVYLHEGETNSKFWIDVLLTIIGYLLFGFAGIFFLGSLPGIIYALIVILGD